MRKISILSIAIALFALAFVPFMGNATGEAQKKKLLIVTTTSQIGDLIQNIVGDSAHVEFLMGTGIDPHMYHPTRSDVSKLLRADIVFYNGMNLEGKMEEFLEKLSKDKKAISVADLIRQEGRIISNDGSYDPHIWMDVQNWVVAANQITKTLSDAHTDKKDVFETNAQNYTQKLIELDNWAKESFASIPEKNRVLVTAHDAFGYMGHAYGLDVIGIQGLSTESEAGLKTITSLVSMISDRKIPSLFIETSVADHNIRAVIEGARIKGAKVEIGGKLYSDAMGDAGTHHGTYLGMMEYNIRTISKTLGGTPKPLQATRVGSTNL